MFHAMTATDQIIALCTAYGTALGLEPKTVSSRVFGDSKKLTSIMDGADIQTRRYEGAVVWLSRNWPEGATWPQAIARPSVPELDQ